MIDFAHARSQMVERQIERRGVRDRRVMDAMGAVPRELFVPERLQEFAYEDTPLPIEEGQTISQPYIVAAMAEAAAIRPSDRVLEVGAGSGYAAAVFGQLASRVVAIERHPALARLARERIERLGSDHVEIVTGDGTFGWPDEAPYDVIIGSAGAPEVPEAWREQLAVGGRIVMPVGEEPRRQRLVKLTRTRMHAFEEEDLGDVVFVPLVGEHGWREDESGPTRPAEPRSFRPAERERPLADMIGDAAELLPGIADAAFGALFDRWADRKVVLLGEASHGTSEFYRARAAITRRLVEAHGFTIVAVEADWPDAAMVDRYVRHRPTQHGSEPPFRRFPTWMWRNVEVDAFMEWLRAHNDPLPMERRCGFFGLDLYNLSASIAAVLAYLDQVDPEAAAAARERYGCLTPWQKDPAVYGRAVLGGRHAECEPAVVDQLKALLSKQLDYARAEDGALFLDAAQNARLITAAERYYRIMYYGGAESWNLRDTHMFDTLTHLLEAHGPDAKAVVWAHNSHIGDARYTEMGVSRDELNIGQLCRERFGDRAALIGFGTHAGTVAAASDWGGEMEIKTVRPSRQDSYERLCHDAGVDDFLLDLGEGVHESLRHRLLAPRLERFIGVIYRPESELMSHYAEASLPRQFDAFVWFDQTSAVTPLPTVERPGVADTYPFGL
jgi:protein-L-isoaspartate(D-aspartate) O-methyltransferase